MDRHVLVETVVPTAHLFVLGLERLQIEYAFGPLSLAVGEDVIDVANHRLAAIAKLIVPVHRARDLGVPCRIHRKRRCRNTLGKPEPLGRGSPSHPIAVSEVSEVAHQGQPDVNLYHVDTPEKRGGLSPPSEQRRGTEITGNAGERIVVADGRTIDRIRRWRSRPGRPRPGMATGPR